MKSFSEFNLQEGVIKVPPKLYKNIETFVWQTTLGLAYDKSQQAKKNPDEKKYTTWYDKQIKKWKVKKQVEKKDEYTKVFNYDLKSMASHYPKDKVKRIKVILSSKRVGDSGGHFAPKENELVINIGRMDFDRYPDSPRGYDVNNFKVSMEGINTTLRHELMHSVQYNLLQKVDPNQVKDQGYMIAMALPPEKLKKYKEKFGKDFVDILYYSSQLEFDPQIVTAVNDFKFNLELKKLSPTKDKDEVLKLFRKFVGLDKQEKSRMVNDNSSAFFNTLKKQSPDKWELAVKKIYQELSKKGVIKQKLRFKERNR